MIKAKFHFLAITCIALSVITLPAIAKDVQLTSVYGSKEQAFLLSTLNLNQIVRDVVRSTGQKPDMGYAKIDLNADGISEYIVGIFSPTFCNAEGCVHHVYQKINNRWQTVAKIYTKTLSTGAKGMHGYDDLHISRGVLHWTGTTYTPG